MSLILVRSCETDDVDPASNEPRYTMSLIPVRSCVTDDDLASNELQLCRFADSSNASFDGVTDTGNTCISSVIDTNDTETEFL